MGPAGFEPAISAMSRRRHSQLDHGPKKVGGLFAVEFGVDFGDVHEAED